MMKKSILAILILGGAVPLFGQIPEKQEVDPKSEPTLQGQTVKIAPKATPVLLDGRAQPAKKDQPKPNPSPAVNTETIVEEDEVLKIDTSLVTVPVAILDRQGRFVEGLKREDFQILENGTKQEIDYFAPLETPFTVVLMLDVSPSARYKIEEIQNAAMKFVDQLRDNDKVVLVTFDQYFRTVATANSNKAATKNAIKSIKFGAGTRIYEAVDTVVLTHLKKMKGRKAVVLFTDGVDTQSRKSNIASNLRSLDELDALFYTIRYDTFYETSANNGVYRPNSKPKIDTKNTKGVKRSVGTSFEEYEKGRKYLLLLSKATGGRSFEAASLVDLDKSFSSVAEELRHQYSIGYYPNSETKPGERRLVKVRIARPNLVVRTKTSYVTTAKQ